MTMSRSPGSPSRKFISQAGLNSWLDELAATRALIAPRLTAGLPLYQQVAGSQEIAWGISRSVLSIKQVFFPPTERLMVIRKNGQEIRLEQTIPEEAQIVFGVRPCEARGARLLDALFLDTPPADLYYASRRENTLLIGLACREMGPTCFCSSVGGAPNEAGDVDVMLYEVDDGYALEEVTDKGASLVAGLDLTPSDYDPQAHSCKSQNDIANPLAIEWPELFEDEYWQKISERCLSCRACAYVCPTCRCFAIRDESIGTGGFERLRCWDSCAGENYRRLAGGHKARPEKGDRLRNRIFCKFHYFGEETGLGNISACTGCGRCIDVCPVGVDITEVLADLVRQA
jgi:sulfhydrogenase subunit beta (sulfur reductase)